jgi:hypothetical protein
VRPVVAGLPGLLHLGQDDVGDPVREQIPAGPVPDAALAQFRGQRGQVVSRDPPAP